MNQKDFELLDYLEILKRHKWIMIAAFIVVTGLGTLYTLSRTPLYRATVTILIDRKTPEVLERREMNPLGEASHYQDYYNTQLQILQSRDIKEKAVQRMGRMKNGEGKITVEPNKRDEKSYIARLCVTHPDPDTAARFANTMAEVFVEENIARRLRAMEDIHRWLAERTHESEESLAQAEKELEAYRQRSGEISLQEAQDITVSRLQQLNAAYTGAQDARISAQARYQQAEKRTLEESDYLPDEVTNPLIMKLRQDLSEKQIQYNRMLKLYTASHPEMQRLSTQINDIGGQIAREAEKEKGNLKRLKQIEWNQAIDQYKREYESALQHERAIESELKKQKSAAMRLSERAVTYNIHRRSADTKRDLYQMLLQQTQDAGISSEIRENNLSILDRAKTPQHPVFPKTSRNIVMSMLLSLIMGGGLVLLAEYTHDTINSPEDISETAQKEHVKILSSVPLVRMGGDKAPVEILDQKHNAQAVNAFGLLRTNLLFPKPEKPIKNILITSSIRAEGKTFVSCNLAISLANIGNRTLIVDVDLRKPRMHKIFNLSGKKGLSEYLVGEAELDEVIYQLPVSNLSLIPCGKALHNPELLLTSPKMQELGSLLKEKFDFIVYDSPPVSPVADAIVIAASVADKTIIITRAEHTPRRLFKHVLDTLEEARQGIVAGVVINEVVYSSGYRYYRYYKYYKDYYGQEPPPPQP